MTLQVGERLAHVLIKSPRHKFRTHVQEAVYIRSIPAGSQTLIQFFPLFGRTCKSPGNDGRREYPRNNGD